jgi:hypothetical protein
MKLSLSPEEIIPIIILSIAILIRLRRKVRNGLIRNAAA